MNERGYYGNGPRIPRIGAEPGRKPMPAPAPTKESEGMSASSRVLLVGGLLILAAGIPLAMTAKELREDKRAVESRAKHKRIWEQANPDLPYWPADVPPEKQSTWLATRQAWEAKHPEQGHLPWQGQLGIRVPK